MPTTGHPCNRPSCGHGHGLHDDEGCTFCSCGYFLNRPLMEEVQAMEVWRSRVVGRHEDSALYGWLRVFEGYTHEQASALLNARPARKPLDSRRKRRDKVMADLGLAAR